MNGIMATNASNVTIMICALFILRDGCSAAAAADDGVVVIMTVLLLMFPFYCSRVESVVLLYQYLIASNAD